MLSLIAILFAIVLLLYAQLLRTVLARPFRNVRASILPLHTPPPGPFVDLYQRAEQELMALGFDRPVWVLHEYDPGAVGNSVVRVYRHAGQGSLVWLGPPRDLRYPNCLSTRFTTRLTDGRTLCSQAFDPYFDVTATPETLRRALRGEQLEKQWEQHLRWRAGFAQATDPRSLEEEAILEEAGERQNSRIEWLLQRRYLWRDASGVARARLGFGLRLLLRLLRRPAQSDLREPVPAARLASLSDILEQVRSSAVPAPVQWGLFVTSVVLFLALSGLFWDRQFALILLGVVAFHEAGHYLAMRAFGYRNVQMLMLPLVGGVTLGVERTPSPAQRAWMSLMGPLPGILLGWALLGWTLLQPADSWPVLRSVATTLLIVNYLNIMPLPPLDGSRVVQALLPARWTGLQAIFVAVACVVGGMAAVGTGYARIGLIAFATLGTLPYLWQRRNVVRALLREGVPSLEEPSAVRLTRVLETFERQGIPMKGAQARILQAEAVLQVLDTGLMAWRQRLTLGGLYALLLVVPVVALVGYWSLGLASGFRSFGIISSPGVTFTPVGEAATSVYDQALVDASKLDVGRLVADLQKRRLGTAVAGLSEERIAAIEARLGVRLPDDLRAVYRVSDGLALLDLAPLEKAVRPDAAFLARISAVARDGEVEVVGSGANLKDRRYFAKSALFSNTVRLGPSKASGFYTVLLDLNQPLLAPGQFLISVFDNGRGTFAMRGVDLRARLQASWAAQQVQDVFDRERENNLVMQRAALRGEDVEHLLAHFPDPGFLVRTFFHVRAPRLRQPATEAQVSATEHRLGQSLPSDLRAALLIHDGYPRLGLLPVASYFRIEAGERRGCVVIGGFEQEKARALPRTLWCPQQAAPGMQIVELADDPDDEDDKDKMYPDFTAWLTNSVARYLVDSHGIR
jgi:Zn-dependent protease